MSEVLSTADTKYIQTANIPAQRTRWQKSAHTYLLRIIIIYHTLFNLDIKDPRVIYFLRMPNILNKI